MKESEMNHMKTTATTEAVSLSDCLTVGGDPPAQWQHAHHRREG
jgi:hypothetical protein